MMIRPATAAAPGRPLCVDLDGTLIATDMLWESVLLVVRQRPWLLFALPFWWIQGKARLKRRLAERVLPNPASLPYRQAVLEEIERARESGRPVLLVTASDQRIAEAVAAHLGVFDEVLGSDGTVNLRGEAKRDLLESRFGASGFDYAGDSKADLPVWRASARALVVAAGPSTLAKARSLADATLLVQRTATPAWAVLKALRPHQWVKNILIFVPTVLSHRLDEPAIVAGALAAFAAFSLCASAGYIINDLLDLESDRAHPRKRHRPLASGALSIPAGFMLALLAMGGGIALSLAMLPWLFSAALGGYLLMTATYSAFLKRRLIVDVVVLALMFTYRVLAGGLAVSVPVSFWLLAFSLFFFTGLAFAKRYSELVRLRSEGRENVPGRSYRVADLAIIRSVGSSSGLIAVMVFALYINSPKVQLLYVRPEALWLICPVFLYWITRIWFLAARNALHDDPIVFALKDRVSYLAGAVTAACIIAATW